MLQVELSDGRHHDVCGYVGVQPQYMRRFHLQGALLVIVDQLLSWTSDVEVS